MGLFSTSLYISFLQFWQRKDQGFVALVGILVALCLDGAFLHVFVSSLMFMYAISLLFAYEIKQISDKGRIHEFVVLCL